MGTLRNLISIAVLIVASPLWGANHTVTVDDDFFSPADLTIEAGDSVTWTNQGNNTHNVVADDGSFRCAQGCDDMGGNGNPSAAAWSFTLTFNDPGMIPYFCEVHGAAGGIGMAGTITVEESEDDGGAGEAVVAFVPIAGSVMGANNAFFRTFLRVFNPSMTDMITVGAEFLVAGEDNTAAPEMTFMLSPGEVRIFEDAVSSIFDESGLGAIRLHSDDMFQATSRIFTDSQCADPEGGTFGQFVPAIKVSDALTSGAILHLNFSDAFRSNIGFANMSESPAALTLRLWGPGGMMAETGLSLDPRGALAPTAIRDAFGLDDLDQENLYVTFESDQPVFGYGSVVDNITGDQIFIPACMMM